MTEDGGMAVSEAGVEKPITNGESSLLSNGHHSNDTDDNDQQQTLKVEPSDEALDAIPATTLSPPLSNDDNENQRTPSPQQNGFDESKDEMPSAAAAVEESEIDRENPENSESPEQLQKTLAADLLMTTDSVEADNNVAVEQPTSPEPVDPELSSEELVLEEVEEEENAVVDEGTVENEIIVNDEAVDVVESSPEATSSPEPLEVEEVLEDFDHTESIARPESALSDREPLVIAEDSDDAGKKDGVVSCGSANKTDTDDEEEDTLAIDTARTGPESDREPLVAQESVDVDEEDRKSPVADVDQVQVDVDEPAPKPPTRHRRTPSVPVNVIIEPTAEAVRAHQREQERRGMTPPVAPRRHVKTSSLVDVYVRSNDGADGRCKTAEPSIDLDDIEIPVVPARRKKATDNDDDDKNDDATSNNEKDGEMSPKSDNTASEQGSIVTQEQLVAELKTVLKKKNRYIEVVPDGSRREKAEDDDDDEDVEEEDGRVEETEENETEVKKDDLTISRSVVTQQPSSSPRRLIEIAIVGDEVATKNALCRAFVGSSDVDTSKLLSHNFVVDGAEVALFIHNKCATEGADELQVNEAYRKADVVICCFSQNNAQSLQNIRKRWLPEVRNVKSDIPVVLAAQRHIAKPAAEEADEVADDEAEKEAPVLLSSEECQSAARGMGAATCIEYAIAIAATRTKDADKDENEGDETGKNEKDVFEAAVKAFAAHESQRKPSPSQEQQQQKILDNSPKRKRCCVVM